MRCKKAMAQFSAYLDGPLTVEERKAVREHLAGCERCRAELEALDRAAYAVADLPRLRAPSDLRDQVMAKLEGVKPAEARPPRWRMYWGAAAAVVFAVAIMLLTRSPTPRGTAPEPIASVPRIIPPGVVAQADRRVPDGSKSSEAKLLPTAAHAQPLGLTPVSSEVPTIKYFEVHDATPVGPKEEITVFLPSANPRVGYLNAIAAVARGGWLPAGLQKDDAADALWMAGEKKQDGQPEPRLTLHVKQSEVPLLEKALTDAAILAFEGKEEEAKEAGSISAGAPQPARAEAGVNEAEQPAAAKPAAVAPAAAFARRDDHAQPTNAAAGAAPAGAGGVIVSSARPLTEEKAAQETGGATLDQARKVVTVRDPIVEVTLEFSLLESPVPAAALPAAPATGAANSATPQ